MASIAPSMLPNPVIKITMVGFGGAFAERKTAIPSTSSILISESTIEKTSRPKKSDRLFPAGSQLN